MLTMWFDNSDPRMDRLDNVVAARGLPLRELGIIHSHRPSKCNGIV